jgi:hypothetical protein
LGLAEALLRVAAGGVRHVHGVLGLHADVILKELGTGVGDQFFLGIYIYVFFFFSLAKNPCKHAHCPLLYTSRLGRNPKVGSIVWRRTSSEMSLICREGWWGRGGGERVNVSTAFSSSLHTESNHFYFWGLVASVRFSVFRVRPGMARAMACGWSVRSPRHRRTTTCRRA